MTDNGTNFNGTGQFEFALVTSTNANQTAAATATAPSGGYITGYNITYAGNGYTGTTVPLIITGGGGLGAAAHGNISGGLVTSITVDNPGNGGYSSAPTVTIAAPPAAITYTTYWSNDGTSVAGSEPAAAVNVNVANGLFTVVLGDTTIPGMAAIPATLFSQPNLQLRIWFDDGMNGFAVMDPAQNVTPVPYATTATQLLGGFTVQNNSSGAPNVIGGASVNFVSSGVVGATIGGGGAVNYNGYLAFSNNVTADFATISGGYDNTASGFSATVGGGNHNIASGEGATISGGIRNTASGYASTAMGEMTVASGAASTAMGESTVASGIVSTAMGNRAQANHQGTFVWADTQSNDGFASTANNQFLIRTAGGMGINTNNPGATLDVNGSIRVGAGTTVFNNLQGGMAQMASGSSTVKTNFTFLFPKAFSTVPKVIISPASGNSVPVDDTFAVSVRALTTTTCTVNIVRVDNPSGWSQQVKINWLAWE